MPEGPGNTPILPSDVQDGGEKLLAGKFKTPEELEKGYQNLVTLLGKQGKVDDKGNPVEPPKADPKPNTIVPGIDPAAASAVVSEKGIDYNALVSEFVEKGALSEETYKALDGRGIPKEMVDQYIAGQTALAANQQAEVFSVVGGVDTYDKMIKWAGSALSPAEQKAFNESLNGSMDAVKWAVQGLHAKYTAAVGQNPNLVQGDAPSVGGSVYASRQEMTADMADPRYAKDPAFRKMVEDKLRRSMPQK